MRPELFVIPYLNISIKSYGFMMVCGFLAALYMARRRCRKLGENPEHITNFGIYALLSGVFGARLMHVLHNWDSYRNNLGDIFAVWNGGLEFLGGVAAAIVVMLIYFRKHKLPILKFLDILAPALMLGLAFGRMGCLLNGCCFGQVCNLPWAIEFPAVNKHTVSGIGKDRKTTLQYSYPFDYQLYPDPSRRPGKGPLLKLPDDYYSGRMRWGDKYYPTPKNPNDLTKQQIQALTSGEVHMHPVHPAQIYSIANALILCVILNLLFRRKKRRFGFIFSWMMILYGLTRFGLEMLRTEPVMFDRLSISQNMGLMAVLLGIIILIKTRKQPVISENEL